MDIRTQPIYTHTTVEGALATLRDAAGVDADTAAMLLALADRVYGDLA